MTHFTTEALPSNDDTRSEEAISYPPCVVGYIRVSTDKQMLGTGTVRQRDAIEAYARAANIKIVEIFEESHSAVDDTPLQERPEFAKATEMARRMACPILVEKFDRLSRNQMVYAEWRESSRVRIVAVCEEDVFDTPGERARIAAAAANAEAKAAGQNAAYTRMRAEGRPIGNPKPSSRAHERSAEIRRQFAQQRHLKIADVLDELGHDLPRPDLARVLNDRGISSSSGKPWTPGRLATDHKKVLKILATRVQRARASDSQDEADWAEMTKQPGFAIF